MNLSRECKFVRASNAVAAGTTASNSDGVDTAGFEAVCFIAAFGTITDGTPSIKLQQSDDDGVADAYSDLLGTSVAGAITDDNKMLMVDLVQKDKRYVRCVTTRGGSTGAVLDGVLACLYRPNSTPVTQHASVAAAELHAPTTEGTA